MDATAILQPVIAMGLLTLVMTAWMFAIRIPAISKAGMDPQDARDTSHLKSLPPEVTQVADNYNHLFEQPTLFYAIALFSLAWIALGTMIAREAVAVF